MAGVGHDLARQPLSAGAFLGMVGAPPLGGAALGQPGPQDPLCAEVPRGGLPLWRRCWHGECCPWLAQGKCFWNHSPMAPHQTSTRGPPEQTQDGLLASGCAPGFVAGDVSRSFEDLILERDVRISKALAEEVHALEKLCSASADQSKLLLAEVSTKLGGEVGALGDRLAALLRDVQQLLISSEPESEAKRFDCFFAKAATRFDDELGALRRQLADLWLGATPHESVVVTSPALASQGEGARVAVSSETLPRKAKDKKRNGSDLNQSLAKLRSLNPSAASQVGSLLASGQPHDMVLELVNIQLGEY